MNNYSLIITNKYDYEFDIKNKFSCAGFPSRNKSSLERMNEGDGIIYYVTKLSKFVAVVEVTGEAFYSTKQIWVDPYDVWPCRIPTKPLLFAEDPKEGVFIKDIWDDLEFITNKGKWGSQVQGSFRRISKHDYDIIFSSLKEQITK